MVKNSLGRNGTKDAADVNTNGAIEGPAWAEGADIPIVNGLTQTTSVALPDGTVIGGGLGIFPDVTVSSVESYDPSSDTWVSLTDFPTTVRAFGAGPWG